MACNGGKGQAARLGLDVLHRHDERGLPTRPHPGLAGSPFGALAGTSSAFSRNCAALSSRKVSILRWSSLNFSRRGQSAVVLGRAPSAARRRLRGAGREHSASPRDSQAGGRRGAGTDIARQALVRPSRPRGTRRRKPFRTCAEPQPAATRRRSRGRVEAPSHYTIETCAVEPLGESALILRDLPCPAPVAAARLQTVAGRGRGVGGVRRGGGGLRGPVVRGRLVAGAPGERRRAGAPHRPRPLRRRGPARGRRPRRAPPKRSIRLHAREYECRAVGFCPGFAYLAPLPPEIDLPRRDSPRPRVAPGSVALAAGMTAVYPLERPGGWWLIGRTPLDLGGRGRRLLPDPRGRSGSVRPIDWMSSRPEEASGLDSAVAVRHGAWRHAVPPESAQTSETEYPSTMAKRIDLNVDIGEGFPFDRELLRFATSANVGLGEHAGSREITAETVALCREAGVRVGAHPGYPHRPSMGRDPIPPGAQKAYLDSIFVQTQWFVAVHGADYLKPHGAFYNDTAVVLPEGWRTENDAPTPYGQEGIFLAQTPRPPVPDDAPAGLQAPPHGPRPHRPRRGRPPREQGLHPRGLRRPPVPRQRHPRCPATVPAPSSRTPQRVAEQVLQTRPQGRLHLPPRRRPRLPSSSPSGCARPSKTPDTKLEPKGAQALACTRRSRLQPGPGRLILRRLPPRPRAGQPPRLRRPPRRPLRPPLRRPRPRPRRRRRPRP